MAATTKKVRVKLRSLQREALKKLDARNYGVLICHRRFGKTVLALFRLCRNATAAGSSFAANTPT